jgi:putative two-component system response regulator
MTLADIQPPLAKCMVPVISTNRSSASAGKPSAGFCPAAKMGPDSTKTATIMIVDDEPINIKVVRKYLREEGYQHFITTTQSSQANEIIRRELPDVVLLDIIMPQVSGLEILKTMRGDTRLQHIPVLILTASGETEVKLKALELGVTDFLTKPVEVSELLLRVRNALLIKAHHDHLANYSVQLEQQVRLRTAELIVSRQEVIRCLARAAEYRDHDTGNHVVRVGRFAAIIARQLGFDQERLELLEQAAMLHDVGKIGIPDAILLKPGKLDCREWEMMQNHCKFGGNIIQGMPDDELQSGLDDMELPNWCVSPVLMMASTIARTHHEKWDGSGYPSGFAGENIPIEGRITAVADVFDALSSRRPYKPSFPRTKCLAILEEGRGTHFDPKVLDAFFACIDQIIAVQNELADLD